MSVAAATGAVSTHQHQQPTAEQIRLAQLIDDKKHDQPEVQDIVRKVLEVVANSTQEEALVALFDCDYDYERTVALLIEKGHDIASEWRTATNHKLNKKQQQKNAAMKNGFGGENDENAQQQQQRGNDGFSQRGKSRAGRSRFQQQHNGGDIQNNTTNTNQQQNDNNYNPQQRQRGGSGYRGRNRGGYRGGSRGNDRNHQQYEQQPQDSNLDTSSPSDTTQRFTDVPYTNRRGGGAGRQQQQQQQQQRWDVGNWNGETLIYSRSSKDEEQQASNSDNNTSNTINGPAGGTSNVNNGSELNTQQKSKSEFDPVEAARHIKNVIGIGQSQQQQQQQQQQSNASAPKPLMDIKPLMGNQQLGQQQKSNIVQSKSMGQNLNTKITTPPPPPRIPHQPVIFSDRFDGGMHKIDIQFGNLGEPLDDTSSQNVSVPIASSSSSFYQHSEPTTSVTKQNAMLSSVHNSQRSTIPHHSTEQSSFVSPSAHAHSTRPSEQQQHQQPVMNQQRVLPPHMQQQQQPSMAMKNVVPPQYAVHPQQHQMNAQNLLIQSLLYHAHPQQESVPLDTSYDPAAFQLPSLDFNTTYFVAPTLNQQPQQPQTQQRYLVSQPPLPPQQPQSQQQQQHQQTASNRQASSNNVQTTPSSAVPSSSTSTTSSTAPKKGPAVPPGMFISTAPPTQPAYSNAYSTTYGVPPSVGGQQQTSATTYSTPYDPEHVFTTAFMQLANPQAQSPSGTYGSVTPPVQQPNQQQALNNNDNKTMNYRAPFNENLVLLQQYQQYAIQQSNSQQQGQQATGHSSAPLSYFLGHPASGPSYSPGPPIMFAQPTTAMTQQQQTAKQQGQQYNQNNPSAGIGGNDDYYGRASSSSANKEAQYMYTVSTQPQQGPPQSVGQQHGVNKQQQRASGNVYNNQQRPFQ